MDIIQNVAYLIKYSSVELQSTDIAEQVISPDCMYAG